MKEGEAELLEETSRLREVFAPAGVPAETWRCVNNTSPCGGTVTQVSRGGVWVNFNCNPRGCNACCGTYSINCDQ